MPKNIIVHPETCTGCQTCTLMCSFLHQRSFRPDVSRIQVFTWENEGISVPVLCQQCEDAPCLSICPTGALSRNPKTQAIALRESYCIHCRMCVQACPFGSISYDAVSGTVEKCDLCGGNPNCVQFCPTGALEFIDDAAVANVRSKEHAARIKEAVQEVK
jgi:carbon-monoxide dehydrogenase iron sulfur subunit